MVSPIATVSPQTAMQVSNCQSAEIFDVPLRWAALEP
jgi:hypothetical protein